MDSTSRLSLDVADFRLRWRRARISALMLFQEESGKDGPDAGQPGQGSQAYPGKLDTARDDAAWLRLEQQLFLQVAPENRNPLLRAVFDRSHSLASSMVRYFRRTWDCDELCDLLAQSGIPCLGGVWRREAGTCALIRSGCAELPGAFGCSYWREATDGLVMGLGDEARYARHRGIGHGDPECVDLLYPVEMLHLRWGPLPPTMPEAFSTLQSTLAKDQVELRLEGYSEGTLFYRLESDGTSPCGIGRTLLCNLVERECQAHFPGIKTLEISERPVL